MNILQAIEKLKQGKKVQRSKWLKGDFLTMKREIIITKKIWVIRDDGGNEYRFRAHDLTAKNWRVLK